MSKIPFKMNKLLNPHAVIQHQSKVRNAQDKCLADAQKISDKRGDIYAQLSPARKDELKLCTSRMTVLTEDMNALRQERLSLQEEVTLISDELATSANQKPEDRMEQCSGLGLDDLATLLVINQLAFKGTEIPGLSDKQRDTLRADAKLLEVQAEKDSALVTSLNTELETEREAASKLRMEITKLRKANDDKGALVSEHAKTIKRLNEEVSKLETIVAAKLEREDGHLSQIQILKDMSERLTQRADVEQAQRNEIIAEKTKLQEKLAKEFERNKHLQEKLDIATLSKDKTSANITAIQWTLEQEKLSNARFEERLESMARDWEAKLCVVKLQKDELESKFQVESFSWHETLGTAQDDAAVWHGRATRAENELQTARVRIANWEKDELEELQRVTDLRHDLDMAQVERKNSERLLASSEERVRKLERELAWKRQENDAHEARDDKEVNKILKSVDALRRKLESKEEETLILRASLLESNGKRDDARVKAEQEAAELRQQNSLQEALLKESDQAKSRLDEQSRNLRDTVDSLKEHKKSLQEELNKTQVDLHLKAQRLEVVELDLEQQKHQNVNISKDHKESMQRLTESFAKSSVSLSNLLDKQHELQEQLDTTQQKLTDEKGQNALIRDELRQSQIRFQHDIGDRVSESLENVQTTKGELTSLKEAYTTLQREHREVLESREREKNARQNFETKMQQSEARFHRSEEWMTRYVSQLELVFRHICTGSGSAASGELVRLLQSEYYTYDGLESMQPSWSLLGSWDAEDVSPVCIQTDMSVEILIFLLFDACAPNKVATPLCLGLMRTLSRVMGTCAAIQPDLLVGLVDVFVRSVSLMPEDAFEAGFALFQMMSIVEKRWQMLSNSSSRTASVWIKMKNLLQAELNRTPYRKLFFSLQFDVEPHELVSVPRHTWGNMLVMCEPSWPKAVVFDLEHRSIRFFAKMRLTIDDVGDGFRIVPVPSEEAIILSPWTMDGSMWIMQSFWGTE